jgi:hypothetical protein
MFFVYLFTGEMQHFGELHIPSHVTVTHFLFLFLSLGRPGFDSRQEPRIFLVAIASRQALGHTQPPSVPGTTTLVLTQPRSKADHSPYLVPGL